MEPETTQAPIAQFHEHPSVCLGVSGSIAVVKTLEIVSGLLAHGVSVDVVVTESAYKLMQATYHGAQPWGRLLSLAAASQEHAAATTTRAATHASLPAASISATGGGVLADHAATLRIFRDIDEWSEYGAVGSDSVLHIEIAKRNQVLLLAPLCANMLAHAALGLCSNLLGSVLRAWYYDLEEEFAAPLAARYGEHAVSRPILVAPAMNTVMWHQRLTSTHLETLRSRGVSIIPPQKKMLACGDVGMGAMAQVDAIVETTLSALREYSAASQQAVADGKPPFIVS